ncbi:hypothetical protein HaLaN_24942 [Haematococcus lacustris]|uniref:Uncharacterized protein n=1 Tax=Haematococcus lacustris TaxID=44745 RepID=A0A6A0A320_HAELA|nr:hypothetical protein HaLaN_24942 [Haematococcus lacustris]
MESGALLGKGATGAGPGPWAADQTRAMAMAQASTWDGCCDLLMWAHVGRPGRGGVRGGQALGVRGVRRWVG